MPILNPGDNSYKPRDWRQAYDAFANFKRAVRNVSTKLGQPIDTSGWHLTFPGRFKGYADPRWQLTFSRPDFKKLPIYDKNGMHQSMDTIFIGSDGLTARKTIRELHNQYIQILLERSKYDVTTDPRKLQQQNDPRFDHNIIRRMMERWNAMQKVKSVGEWEENLKQNPDVIKFMNSRAGFLNMTMREYLYKHPMSHKWPTPPTTKQQLDARIRQDEAYERELNNERNRPDNIEVDPGPGWMG
jgi:hypothetical protein